MTDNQLIALLRSDQRSERNKGFGYLVNRDFEAFKAYVLKNGGNLEDAKDAFQEGLIALLKNLQNSEFESRAKLKSYLFSICKNIWLQQIRKMKETYELKQEFQDENEVAEKQALEEKYLLIKEKFSSLGEECKKILIQFYYDKMSMRELKEIYQLSSEQAAKNKKSRCLKKLSTMVLEHNEA